MRKQRTTHGFCEHGVETTQRLSTWGAANNSRAETREWEVIWGHQSTRYRSEVDNGNTGRWRTGGVGKEQNSGECEHRY